MLPLRELAPPGMQTFSQAAGIPQPCQDVALHHKLDTVCNPSGGEFGIRVSEYCLAVIGLQRVCARDPPSPETASAEISLHPSEVNDRYQSFPTQICIQDFMIQRSKMIQLFRRQTLDIQPNQNSTQPRQDYPTHPSCYGRHGIPHLAWLKRNRV
ncbi:hypothetical protein LX32DRAFT_215355 [Colletotrichum zoysiae]|uniref:Uncharacterized protein n=1 Tax=Colletotrichum zoysiae TaxID=1216348 RepID=A0AAD9H4I0_9PEZI|nr:hypothetical protein LX32DRAFT_215355 [Colletotrichum zoysiae]